MLTGLFPPSVLPYVFLHHNSNLLFIPRVSLDLLVVQTHALSWDNKTDLLFWRGRDSRQERLDLVKLSRRHPDIINARLTNMFFFKKDEELYGEIVKAVSFLDFFEVAKT